MTLVTHPKIYIYAMNNMKKTNFSFKIILNPLSVYKFTCQQEESAILVHHLPKKTKRSSLEFRAKKMKTISRVYLPLPPQRSRKIADLLPAPQKNNNNQSRWNHLSPPPGHRLTAVRSTAKSPLQAGKSTSSAN